MPSGIRRSKLKPSDLLEHIGSKHALDWWVFAIFCVAALEAQLVFDYDRLGGALELWALVAISGLSIIWLSFWLARKFLKPLLTKNRPYLILTFFAVAGFFRGVTMHEVSTALALEDESQHLYRYVVAPIFTIVLLSTFAILVGTFRGYQASIAELTKERARLRLASINLKSEIDKTHSALQSRIFGILGPALDELENRLEAIKDKKSLTSAVTALKNTVDDVVRPLSHNVAQTNFEQLVLETNQTISQDSRQQRYKLKVTLRPVWSALISVMIGFGPSLVSNSTAWGGFVTIILGLVIFSVLTSVNFLTKNQNFEIWQAGVITVAAHSLSMLLFIVLSGLFETNPTVTEQTQMMTLITLLGVLMFAYEWSASYRARNLESARKVNERFELLNSRLRRQVWLDHRRMASILHGQLQGTLYAAAIRLNQSGEPNPFLIENVKSEIQQALNELSVEARQDQRFEAVLGEILEMWEDVVDFKTQFDAEAIEALNKSSEANECAIEVIREGINNAVRHGGAKKISVSVKLASAQLVELRVVNEGQRLPEQEATGFGTSLISEYTHRWWRKSTETGVELGAQVLL